MSIMGRTGTRFWPVFNTCLQPTESAMLAKSQPTATVEKVMPMRAQEYLERSKGNRKLRAAAVARYATDMREGRWRLNGEAIQFDVEGELANGHHRLTACVQAGVPFETFVIRGIEKAARDTHDTGLKRTPGDVLGMAGCANANVVAAAIRWVINIRQGKGMWNAVIPPGRIREFWNEYQHLSDSAHAAATCRDFLQPGIGTAMHFLFAERDPDAARRFFSDLSGGSGLAEDDPVFVLREGLLRARLQKAKLPGQEIAARVIRAWNFRRRGSPARQVKGIIKGDNGLPIFPDIA